MIFLPIVERELRLASRKRGTFWLRVIAALVAVVIGVGFMVIQYVTAVAFGGGRLQLGGPLFSTLTWLCFAAALSAGLFFTSDCLSEEKREGTLGFLFLTDLRGTDVVLGKLAATSLRCVFALMAAFPVLAITQLMGGVPPAYFWKTLLALAHAMFFSLAGGMFVSALSRDSQRALAGTFGLLLLFLAGGPAADGLIALVGKHSFQPLLSLSSPGFVFVTAGGWSGTYWKALLTSQLAAWLLLVMACVLVPRTWQEKSKRGSPALSRWNYWWRYGSAKRRASLRRKLLDVNPVMWLACRERWQSLAIWIVSIVLLGLFVGLLVSNYSVAAWMVWGYFGGFFPLVFYLWTASQASRFFVEARRNGLLELLLVVPLSARNIVNGPWRALLRLFAAPVLLFLVVHFLALTLSQRSAWRSYGTAIVAGAPNLISTLAYALATSATTVLVILANLAALAWFGLWMGLTSKSNHVAALKTILLVWIVPWFVIAFAGSTVIGLVLVPAMMPAIQRGTPPNPSGIILWYPMISLAVTTTLSLGKDVFFWTLARRKLFADFREMATKAVSPVRFAPMPPMIKSPP